MTPEREELRALLKLHGPKMAAAFATGWTASEAETQKRPDLATVLLAPREIGRGREPGKADFERWAAQLWAFLIELGHTLPEHLRDMAVETHERLVAAAADAPA